MPEPLDDRLCGYITRSGDPCNLDADHNGQHRTNAWCCDGCSRMRSGTPGYQHEEAGWYCIVCMKVSERDVRNDLIHGY